MLTKKNVEAVRAGVTKYPLLKSSFNEVKADADKALVSPYQCSYTCRWWWRHYP
jgi:hypothetical protein